MAGFPVDLSADRDVDGRVRTVAGGGSTAAGAAAAHLPIAGEPTRVVLIVADPVTGARDQVACRVPANSFSSDVLQVDTNDFSHRCPDLYRQQPVSEITH